MTGSVIEFREMRSLLAQKQAQYWTLNMESVGMKNILRYCVIVIVLSCCLLAISLPVWFLLNQLSQVKLLYVFLYFLLYGIGIVLYDISKNAKKYRMFFWTLFYGIAAMLFVVLVFYIQTIFIKLFM